MFATPRLHRLVAYTLRAVMGAAVLSALAAPSYGQIVTQYNAGITGDVWHIAAGADGNLWFTEYNANKIGRITTSGVVTEFTAGLSPNSGPLGITRGPDGNVWFTEHSAGGIGYITPLGKITEVATGMAPGSQPLAIVTGPDGNLWFTEQGANKIGRMSTSGAFAEFSEGLSSNAQPGFITVGSDGSIWFTEAGGIGRITTGGAITEFHGGFPVGIAMNGIATGADGNLWFTDAAGAIGKMTTSGQVMEFNNGIDNLLPNIRANPSGITEGPDGNIWFTELGNGRVGKITPAGVITQFDTGNSSSLDIAAGPDGNLWAVSAGIVRVVLEPDSAINPLAVSLQASASVVYSPIPATCEGPLTCVTSFLKTDTVTLKALNGVPNNYFAGWTGDCSGIGNCVLSMAVPHSVTATYSTSGPVTYPLNLTQSSGLPTAGGFIQVSLSGEIDCDTLTCSIDFTPGSSVTLVANPDGLLQFKGWSGDCTGTTSCTLTMNGPHNVTANYAVIGGYFALVANVATVGGGSLSESILNGSAFGIPVDSSSGCCELYVQGSIVQVVPIAAVGYKFGSWSGDCTGNGECTVTMDQQHQLTATFVPSIAPQSGYWWYPAEAGRGYVIEYNGTNIFMGAFLYDASGRSTWYGAGPAPLAGSTFSAPMSAYSGGQTLTGSYQPPSQGASPGNISITFTDASDGTLTWPGGTIPITRYPFAPDGLSSPPTTAQPQTGWWYNSGEGGRGYSIEVQDNIAFIAAYMYDGSGNPVWYASGPATLTGNNIYQGSWTSYVGGQTLTGAYRAPTTTTNAGSLTIQFSSPTAGTLTLPNGNQIPIQRFVF